MDITKTLVIGQDVYVVSGCYATRGKVVKITFGGVEVQSLPRPGCQFFTAGIFCFDTEGNGCDGRHTYECGPYKLEAISFAGCTRSPSTETP
jgi:hypothetical protein